MPTFQHPRCRSWPLALLAASALLAGGGCEFSKPEEGHHHHHRGEGPNGGHLAVLGDSGYIAEWLHDDAKAVVTVILIDEDHQEVAFPLKEVYIDVTVQGGDEQRFTLPATNASDDDPPKASQFELQDPTLLGALEGGDQLKAKVVVELDSGTVSGALEHKH